MKYYAAKSAHGSDSSQGFANDTIVMVFTSRSDRDEYVRASSNLSCVAITRREVTSNASNWSMNRNEMIAPVPFSGEYWGIVEDDWSETEIPGYIGTVEVCGNAYANESAERFYA